MAAPELSLGQKDWETSVQRTYRVLTVGACQSDGSQSWFKDHGRGVRL